MPVCSVQIGGASFDDSFYQIGSSLFPNDSVSKQNTNITLTHWNEPTQKEYPPYDHPFEADGNIYGPNIDFIDYMVFRPHSDDIIYGLYQWDTGFVKGSQTGTTNFSNFNAYIPKKATEKEKQYIQYSREEAFVKNEAYEMVSGEKWKMQDAVHYVENVYNTVLSKADVLSFHYAVKEIDVLKISEHQYGYYFIMQMSDQSGHLFDAGSKYTQRWIKKQIEDNKPFPMENYCCAYCYEKEQLSYFEKGFTYSEITPSQETAEILSVSAAAEVIDHALAPSQVFRIPCAELNYVLICKGYPYLEKWGLETDTESAYASYYYPHLARRECEFELRPMWCFRTDQYSDLNQNTGYAFMVDAVNGKLWVIRVSNYLVGNEKDDADRILAYVNGEVN